MSDDQDFPLPFDVTIGHGTHKAGTPFSSLLRRMRLIYEMSHESTRREFNPMTHRGEGAIWPVRNLPPVYDNDKTEDEIKAMRGQK